MLDEKKATKILVNCRLAFIDTLASNKSLTAMVLEDKEGLLDICWMKDLKDIPKYVWIDLDDEENHLHYSNNIPEYFNKILYSTRAYINNVNKTPSIILYSELSRIGSRDSYL